MTRPSHPIPARKFIPHDELPARYQVSNELLDEWLEYRGAPHSVVMNGRRYFRLEELEAWEQEQIGKEN